MKVYVIENAIKVLYYLLLIDGEATDDELQSFDRIGRELDAARFQELRDQIIEDCKNTVENVSLEAYPGIIQTAVDQELSIQTNILAEGISPRLLLWNLLVLAYSNQHFDASEERLVKHIVETQNINESVYYEMKQIAETAIALDNEHSWLVQQERPYTEIRPIVEEIEDRIQVLRTIAENLVSDEVIVPDIEEKNNFVKETFDAISEKVNPVLEETVEKTGKAIGTAADKVGKVQGLDLDYTCLLWDADMRYDNGRWRFYSFNGNTKWIEQKGDSEYKQDKLKYMLNAYRVLLTRARAGMVICVPEGNPNKTPSDFWEDSTRLPEYYDGTYQYLKSVGIEEI